MKKLSSLLFGLLLSATAFGQFTVQVVSANVIKLSYGATNDYSIYDPGFEVPTFYVHCWTNGPDNSTGNGYDDAWTNSNVAMNWDAGAGAYVGMINLKDKVFTNGDKVLPVGTTVNNMGFVFKDLQSGANKQSGDLKATDFGFTPTTIVVLGVSNNATAKKSVVADGKLFSALKGNLSVSVYEMSGKLVRNFNQNATENGIDLNMNNKGIYVVKITNGTQSEVVRFAK